jgi:ABC-2 type transport system ATP-binding protein/lipopolysaccharide transport system ATP-binding protein
MVGQSLSARHAVVALEGVKVRFPIYQSGSRSLKKNLISRGSAWRFARDANDRLTIEALRDISLTVEEGDRLALIGANGAGKTTLLRVMAGGYENIRMRALLLGLPTRIIIDRLQDIADFTELGDYLEMPMRTYSSGMMLRLAFAVATCFEPEVLLMDEWILAGDAHFIAKAQRRIDSFVGNANVLVLASHNLEVCRRWCNRGAWMDRGACGQSGRSTRSSRSMRRINVRDVRRAKADGTLIGRGGHGRPRPSRRRVRDQDAKLATGVIRRVG